MAGPALRNLTLMFVNLEVCTFGNLSRNPHICKNECAVSEPVIGPSRARARTNTQLH